MPDFVKSYLQDVGYQMSDLARDLIKSTSARLGGRRGLHNQMSDFLLDIITVVRFSQGSN